MISRALPSRTSAITCAAVYTISAACVTHSGSAPADAECTGMTRRCAFCRPSLKQTRNKIRARGALTWSYMIVRKGLHGLSSITMALITSSSSAIKGTAEVGVGVGRGVGEDRRQWPGGEEAMGGRGQWLGGEEGDGSGKQGVGRGGGTSAESSSRSSAFCRQNATNLHA